MQLTHGVFPKTWLVAAFGPDVAAGNPLARRICNKPVVLFRTVSGRAAALEDRCSHRAMPLSMGSCEGEVIRCLYHGLEFDANGTCVEVPGQEHISSAAAVRSYPLVEKNRLLWIWMGDPTLADVSRIPDNPLLDDPAWKVQSFQFEIQADWQLMVDNLLDLTHLPNVHRNSIGAAEDDRALTLRVSSGDQHVLMERQLANFDPPPTHRTYASAGIVFNGKVDRWWDVELVPGMVRFWSGTVDAGTGAFDGRRVGGFQSRHIDALTPSTPTAHYYTLLLMRNSLVGSAEMDDRLREMSVSVLAEDKAVVEAQQQRLLEEPERPVFDRRADAAQIQGRRLIQRWFSEETVGQTGTVLT